MNREVMILIGSWVVSLYLLLRYIPAESKRLAWITFLFVQAIAWIHVYIQLAFGLVEFPYREFNKATNMSFSLHYIVYPTIAVFFILFYPEEKGKKSKFLYYLLFSAGAATYSYLIEKYSRLYHFIHWNWIMGLIINMLLLYIIKKYIFWFKKGLV
ncbi:CBO0543 family protein [Bacillus infantis]|uniref:CBO0543 family protein n=1 Tax=Bacillus infantis TaxID=324767 RepID=UPI003CF4D201